jgi:glycosyltransferase involved in cell wall biosynthesis
MEKRKKISICGSCYNESGNIRELYERCMAELKKFPDYDYEFVIADNASTDDRREKLRELAKEDENFKVIMNANNFGPINSGMNAFCASSGDAVIPIATDLQDPPELISKFLEKYENGYDLVCAIKSSSRENPVIFALRRLYYYLVARLSSTPLLQNFTGYGLYSRKVVDAIKSYGDLSYFRGIVAEVGFKRADIDFDQPLRKHGKSSYNIFKYYDYAMTGFVNYTKLPLRLAVFSGFFIAFLSILVALGYLIYKCCNWNSFQVGMAPLVIGLFFFSAVQLIFIGILGEYIGAIYTQVKNKPLVIEEERINFDK